MEFETEEVLHIWCIAIIALVIFFLLIAALALRDTYTDQQRIFGERAGVIIDKDRFEEYALIVQFEDDSIERWPVTEKIYGLLHIGELVTNNGDGTFSVG